MTAPARTAPAPEPARDSARAGNDADSRADSTPAAGLVTARTAAVDAPLLYKVPEVLVMLRMSRTQFYAQVNAGRIHIVKQGTSTRVTADDLANYVRLLRQEAEIECDGQQ